MSSPRRSTLWSSLIGKRSRADPRHDFVARSSIVSTSVASHPRIELLRGMIADEERIEPEVLGEASGGEQMGRLVPGVACGKRWRPNPMRPDSPRPTTNAASPSSAHMEYHGFGQGPRRAACSYSRLAGVVEARRVAARDWPNPAEPFRFRVRVGGSPQAYGPNEGGSPSHGVRRADTGRRALPGAFLCRVSGSRPQQADDGVQADRRDSPVFRPSGFARSRTRRRPHHSGSCTRRRGKRAKSRSVVHRVAPCSTASAAR